MSHERKFALYKFSHYYYYLTTLVTWRRF